MALVTVTTVNDVGLANVVRGVLEQAGIQTTIGGGGTGDVYPTPSVIPFEIRVNDADFEMARDVLAQYETMPDDVDDEE
jgi:hypothetical protein